MAPKRHFRGASLRRMIAIGPLLAGALLVVSACSAGGRSLGADPFRGSGSSGSRGDGTITVEVQNLNFNEISVFAYRRGERIRVGNVGGKVDRSFTLPWGLSVGVQFRIEVVGGRACSTPTITIDPGSEVWIQVPADVGLSQCRATRR